MVLGNPRMYAYMKDSSVLPYLMKLYTMDGGVPTDIAASALMHTASKVARDNKILMGEKLDVQAVRKLKRDSSWALTITGYSARICAYLALSPCNRRPLISLGVFNVLIEGVPRAAVPDVQWGLLQCAASLTTDDDPQRVDPENAKRHLAAASTTFPALVHYLDYDNEFTAEVMVAAGQTVANFLQIRHSAHLPKGAPLLPCA